MSEVPNASLTTYSRRFQWFSAEARDLGSPLYEELAERMSHDRDILHLATNAPQTTVPNLLFAAVRYLLTGDVSDPLALFYADVEHNSRPNSDPYPLFRQYCLAHTDEIQHIISSRLLQTNEVRRCACLLPVFGMISRAASDEPLALVEVGSSAGINLLWDRYGYDYGTGRIYGDRQSPVRIVCSLRGDGLPPVPFELPAISFRVGIDLDPIDLTDTESLRWLRALIWPEHEERRELFRRAVAVAKRNQPRSVPGDALDVLPEVIRSVPRNATLCVFHTFTLNQFSQDERTAFFEILSDESTTRDVFCASIEFVGGRSPQVRLRHFRDRIDTKVLLAYCSGHGAWLEWFRASE